jgi:hypothetical protein
MLLMRGTRSHRIPVLLQRAVSIRKSCDDGMFPSIPRASFSSPAGAYFRVPHALRALEKVIRKAGVRKNSEEPDYLMDISLNNSEIPNK